MDPEVAAAVTLLQSVGLIGAAHLALVDQSASPAPRRAPSEVATLRRRAG
jgi:hypothetical protein